MDDDRDHPKQDEGGHSRRSFLKVLGGGVAGAVVFRPELSHAETATATTLSSPPPGNFGRMFPGEPAFATDSAELKAALKQIGKPGGILDAKDALDQGAEALIADPRLNEVNRNNPSMTQGTTFVGQFMDHDMTFDTSSKLGVPTAPKTVTNARTPAFDLDSVYGGGPTASPSLYVEDGLRFKVENGGLFEDLPRTPDLKAIIADPRNDENLIISQLQAAFLKFHNNAVDRVLGEGVAMEDAFSAARRLTTWHYQWMILHEFLPMFVGQSLVDDIVANGRKFFTPTTPFIPVEFQGAAYRFGHSMVRPSYPANLNGDEGAPFIAFVFDPSQVGQPDPEDMSGGARAPRRFIDWATFFDFGTGLVGNNKRIDTKLSTPLFNLPLATIASPPGTQVGPTSLASRNLLRHITWQMPSGQSLARRMGLPALTKADLFDLKPFGFNLPTSTPLWFYVLREADVVNDGLHLGPVGGRIVGEVIVALLQLDPASYLNVQPGWRPTLPSRTGQFRMADFLTFAGVDPVSRQSQARDPRDQVEV